MRAKMPMQTSRMRGWTALQRLRQWLEAADPAGAGMDLIRTVKL